MRKALLISVIVASLFASQAALADSKALPKPIQTAVTAGLKNVATFPAASGLTGWVLAQGGQTSIVYTTADGKSMLVGALIDEDGQNLTAKYADKYAPKPDMDAAYAEMVSTATIINEGASAGAAKATIYAFFDPNCIFCHLLWKAVQPYEKAGLQVKWIPVAFLKPDSAARAAAILTAKNPTAEMTVNMTKFISNSESGGSTPVEPTKAIADKIAANTALMHRFGASGTPALVYKDKSGKVQAKNGMPRLADLVEITGLPEQKNDDPDLARFK